MTLEMKGQRGPGRRLFGRGVMMDRQPATILYSNLFILHRWRRADTNIPSSIQPDQRIAEDEGVS